jgi:transketolase
MKESKPMSQHPELDPLCINTIRFLAVDAVQKAQSGHPGTPMVAATMAYTLWDRFLKHNPANPDWPDRARFILSPGHASMPSWELFDRQPADYRESVLPSGVRARVAVEAGAKLGWEHYVGLEGAVVGMDGFGASAPAATLYEKFGITAEKQPWPRPKPCWDDRLAFFALFGHPA